MQRTPFYHFHQQRGAKFVDFAGWAMPIHFGSIVAEHHQVRNSGGLFDVSHMGRLKIAGRHARKLLERAVTRRISDMAPKTCRYGLVCNEQGGILDDVIVYRFEQHWWLVVNASNREKIIAHLQQIIAQENMVCTLDDLTASTAMVALQGPKVMDEIGKFSREVPTLKRYTFCEKNLLILRMTISRTGYTGEDGVEVVMNSALADKAIKMLVKDNPDGTPGVMMSCGLGARDTLRLEAAMPLYGHELDESIDPLTAGLAFAVSLNKDQEEKGEPFIGQAALQKIAQDGLRRQRVGLILDGKRTARQGAPVLVGDQPVGNVTSGCLSPTLGQSIAMAYVPSEHAAVGASLRVDLGSQQVDAKVAALPFYKRSK